MLYFFQFIWQIPKKARQPTGWRALPYAAEELSAEEDSELEESTVP